MTSFASWFMAGFSSLLLTGRMADAPIARGLAADMLLQR